MFHSILFSRPSLIKRVGYIGIAGLLAGCTGAIDTSSSTAPDNTSSVTMSSSSINASSSLATTSSAPPMTDNDLDGITNTQDNCPNTMLGEAVDLNGCSSFQRGKTLYGTETCSSCHGDDGAGAGPFPPIKDHNCTVALGQCADVALLAEYIAGNMPSPGKCTDIGGSTCATDIANYMVIEFAPQAPSAEDIDGDGITDSIDQCPNTEKDDIPSIDATGCKNINAENKTVFALNAGGAEYTTADGVIYGADDAKYYSGSLGASNGEPSHEVNNTQDDPLYRKERWGKPLEYAIPLANGTYSVTLHFAEVYFTEANKRIMDVLLENNKVLTGYDIFAEAGGKDTAATETFNNVTVNDSELNIRIEGTTNNGSIVALRIDGKADNDGDADGIADKYDSCPGTQVMVAVSNNGCSDIQRDKDGDGILIPEDVCPNTAATEHGSVATSGQLAGCSSEERNKDSDNDGIADAIDRCESVPGASVGATGCTGNFSLPTASIVSPQMRLTEQEYVNTIQKAFAIDNNLSATFQSDGKGPFNTFTNNAADSTADYRVLVGAANNIANTIAPSFANRCSWNNNAQQCVQDHLAGAFTALTRTNALTQTDSQAIASVISDSLNQGASVEQAVAAAIALMLIDDRTIFQIEVGNNADNTGKTKLTNREISNRISYLLLNSPPDETLLNAQNSFASNPTSIAAQADRLMADTNYKNTVWLFIAEWLNIPPESLGSDMNDLSVASLEETKRFISHIVDNDLPITELFNANYSFINATLASHYGVPAPATNWQRYDFPASALRQGILTHASFLSANGNHGRDINTIFRGKVVFERLFCEKMPPPPPPEQSTSLVDEIADRGTAVACRGCHVAVDPIGRMFDHYGDSGELFATAELEGGLFMDVDIAAPYSGVVDFSQALAGSKAFTHCFSRQVFRFAMGRDATDAESTSFLAIREALDSTGSLNAAMRSLVTSDAFQHVYSTPSPQACSGTAQ